MTSERLNELQVDIAQCEKNIAALLQQVDTWQAKKIAYQGAAEECLRNAGGLVVAGAFTGWLPAPITVIEVPDA